MGVFQIALISIIIFSSIQFVQYLTILIAYFLIIKNEYPYLNLKFFLTTLVSLQNIGMMLVNDHQNGTIVNNTTCTVQALIIEGTQLAIYSIILSLVYSKCRVQLNEKHIIQLGIATLAIMIIPLIMHQTTPGSLLCELDQPSRVILTTICSYIVLVSVLIAPLLSQNELDPQLNKYLVIFTLTQIMEVVSNTLDNGVIDLVDLFFQQVRNFCFMLFFQLEIKDAFFSYCALTAKPSKKKNQIQRQEESIPVREMEMNYKI